MRFLVLERFLAARYLAGAQGRPEGRRFLRFVTVVSIAGVAVGVASLVLALAIVRGFSGEIERKLVGFGAHVQVESLRDAPLDDSEALRASLEQRADVIDVAPVVQDFTLLRRSSRHIEGVSIWGAERVPDFVGANLSAGTATLAPAADRLDGIVLGAALARDLGASPGDRLTAFSPRSDGRTPGSVSARSFRVEGIFETDLADFDALYAFVSIDAARGLFGVGPDQATRLDVRIVDPSAAEPVARDIEESFGFPVMARSIYDVYHSLFSWVRLQQRIIPLVISVIVLVAAFNVIATLLMLILEKTAEIGLLVSIGTSAATVRRTFLLLGLLIGACGAAAGSLLALGMARLQQAYGLIKLPADAYFMRTAPVDPSLGDVVVVAAVTVLLCGASAYLPARFAASVRPVEALKTR